MERGRRAGPIVHDALGSVLLEPRDNPIYDRPIHLRLLFEDPASGEEHYLVRYDAGTRAKWHRHTASHTIVVISGRLTVNGREIGAQAYCHYAAGEPMHHAPVGDEPCLFLNLFHGPSDVEAIDPPTV